MNKREKEELNRDIHSLLSKHKGLNVSFNNDCCQSIFGQLRIVDNNNVLQGAFEIKVLIPESYPYGFPRLFETSNKIERIEDRHIDDKGEACVEITHKQKLIASRGISLSDFFEKYVIPFFCWQLIFDEEGNKNLKEWGHRELGIVQYYCELIRSNDFPIILCLIRAAMIGNIPALNQKCVCGSNKKFKQCHNGILQNIRWFGSKQLQNDFNVISKLSQQGA